MNFKFNIGDHIMVKNVILETEQRAKIEGELMWSRPARIVQRISVECCGGTQLFYEIEGNGAVTCLAEDSLVSAMDYHDKMLELFTALKDKAQRPTT